MVFNVFAFISAGMNARMKLGTLDEHESEDVQHAIGRTHELM